MNRLLFIVAALAACKSAPVAPQPTPMPATPPGPQPAVNTPAPEAPMSVTQTAAPQNLAFPDEDFRKKQPEGTAPHDFKLRR